MWKKSVVVIVLMVLGCSTEIPLEHSPPSVVTEPSAITVNVNEDSKGNELLLVGATSIAPSDLGLFAAETGVDRRIVLQGPDFKLLVQAKHEFQSAGFNEVVIGITSVQ